MEPGISPGWKGLFFRPYNLRSRLIVSFFCVDLKFTSLLSRFGGLDMAFYDTVNKFEPGNEYVSTPVTEIKQKTQLRQISGFSVLIAI
jgi:hypothetical protein